jgi:hypothetical protein
LEDKLRKFYPDWSLVALFTSKKDLNRLFFVLLTLVLFISCEQPEDPVIAAVNDINKTLKKHDWRLSQFIIEVNDEDIPPPLLFNSSDSLILKGKYDLNDMVLEREEMLKYTVNFLEDGTVATSDGQFDLLKDEAEISYFVLNDQAVRIKSRESLLYDYLYDPNEQTISLTLDTERASRRIRQLNDKLISQITNKTPDRIGDLIAQILFNNEALQGLINDVLVDAISGKLSFINEIDPEESSKYLAEQILNALKQVDWQTRLTELLKVELEKLTNIDPEEVSEKIAEKIISLVEEELSVDRINAFILPYIERIPTNSDAVSEALATLIVNLFLESFDESKLQIVIESAWREFTKLNEEQIEVISDTLAYSVSDIWINEQNMTNLLLPFTKKIDETSLFQMGALAEEATDAIRGLVDNVNELFPDLNLEPDYESLQSTLRTAFIAAKPTIGLIGGPEAAASSLAKLIINQFLNQEAISAGFKSALQFLQTIDPEIAASKITTWLVSLELEVGPVLIEYLSDLLSPILENIDPELTAERIATALNNFITSNITKDYVRTLILPLLERFTEINAEEVANFLAERILELDIIEDTINQETIEAVLLPILTSIKETNVEELSQNLINAIVDSGIFEDTITEERVSLIIRVLIYKASYDKVVIANNFRQLTILLEHD